MQSQSILTLIVQKLKSFIQPDYLAEYHWDVLQLLNVSMKKNARMDTVQFKAMLNAFASVTAAGQVTIGVQN